ECSIFLLSCTIFQPSKNSPKVNRFFYFICLPLGEHITLCSGFFSPENYESRAFDHKTNVSRIACLNRINLLHPAVRATYLPEAAA
ncbi:hypothetical protein, partial [Bacillus paralicheniformis]|uniref:hypothetical protein n=1 Tax=Bacillus paralicheniformis TaxID=1648923 RepID=UPI0035F5F1B4